MEGFCMSNEESRYVVKTYIPLPANPTRAKSVRILRIIILQDIHVVLLSRLILTAACAHMCGSACAPFSLEGIMLCP